MATTTRTKADAKAELILLVRSDGFAPRDHCIAVADALGHSLIGRKGKGWIELLVRDVDRATIEAGSGADGTLPWAAALVLRMPLGECAEIRVAAA